MVAYWSSSPVEGRVGRIRRAHLLRRDAKPSITELAAKRTYGADAGRGSTKDKPRIAFVVLGPENWSITSAVEDTSPSALRRKATADPESEIGTRSSHSWPNGV